MSSLSENSDRSEDKNTPVELEFYARPEQLMEVRRLVERLGKKTPLSRSELDDLLTAVDEAAANAIRYGSPLGTRDRVRVVCHLLQNGLLIEVRDNGNGFTAPHSPTMPEPEASGGRGLPLMCALADSVEIASSSRGTTITLKKVAGH